ncbi:unnamed protein product [Fusarium venenatum]|uniref:Uncharacterized protein n=1 Tax=Fusarium venenatum TaxID=56646 RepID=A0A2L2SWY2_9HYPO|nr:uncharacterized protein FVRRES_05714 [Fusarium venenatum]CEI61278.1 unnamed protein product [Fusarium venenatum]
MKYDGGCWGTTTNECSGDVMKTTAWFHEVQSLKSAYMPGIA